MTTASAVFDLAGYLARCGARVEAALDRLLPPEDQPPPALHKAMRYAIFAGGKRVRPILVLAGCEAAGGGPDDALEVACAVEMVHTYSLVHDDLPALDDDRLRRGRPTVHVAFDEATAILTGDALLTHAFEIALGGPGTAAPGGPDGTSDTRRARTAAWLLARAIGTGGMIGGQVDDLRWAGQAAGEDVVRSIHARKTGALLGACPVIGAVMAGAPEVMLSALAAYGSDLGLAFQIVDDILDIEGSAETLGKTAGKDAAAGKATFPAAVGLERSRALARELSQRAAAAARALGPAAEPLAAIAEFVVSRRR